MTAMVDATPTQSPLPELHVDLAQVCVVDGIWQDIPDHMAAFDEARLGAEAPGRGNLYVLVDVSGEVEGRSEVERELVETIRREYAARRGSFTFALSEALRAANLYLYELNRSTDRELRRMAGVNAVLLRGQELYIAQAGPAVVYVEIDGVLHRYPAESDWFTEDQPVLSPQGNASVPLGMRREFSCDLFHASILAGDVFVLATRALTQLAGTGELAQAFANRSAEDIANFLEDIANGSDLSAIVAELVDPHDVHHRTAPPELEIEGDVPAETEEEEEEQAETERALDLKTELPAVEPIQPPVSIAPPIEPAAAPLPEPAPEPVAAAEPEYVIPWETPTAAAEPEATEAIQLPAREPRRRSPPQLPVGAVARVLRSLVGLIALLGIYVVDLVGRALGLIDWSRLGARLNRLLNTFFIALWRGLALSVRLILPGAPPKGGLIPRRASKEPLWLKGVAVVLPLLFIGLAFGAYEQQTVRREEQAAQLVQQARVLLNQAQTKKETDKNGARLLLNQAAGLVEQARGISDSAAARSTYFDIQNELNEVNGVDILYYFLPVAKLADGGSGGGQVIADENEVYVLDRAAGRVLHYVVNDSASRSEPAKGDGVILKVGDKMGSVTVDRIRDIAWVASTGSTKAGLVAVTGAALLRYDAAAESWRATPVADAGQWGDIRAAASFLGNVYLLDASKKQLWKYTSAADGFNPAAAPYLPANSPVDFSRATDMAIDGDVWVLNSSGSILRFRSGQKLPFELSGLDRPLKNATAIYTRPEVDALLIADAGNQRIVEFDKNGKFVRQFRPRAQDGDVLGALRALSANDTKRKFYFISGDTVYLANVP